MLVVFHHTKISAIQLKLLNIQGGDALAHTEVLSSK